MGNPLNKVQSTRDSNPQTTHSQSGCYAKLRGWIVQKITITTDNAWYTRIAKATAKALIIFTAFLLALPTLGLSLYCLYDLLRTRSRILPLNTPQQLSPPATPKDLENQKRIRALESQNTNLSNQLAELKKSRPADLQPQLTELQSEKKILEQSRNQLSIQIEQLSRELNTLKISIPKTSQEHAKQIETLNKEISDKTNELTHLKSTKESDQKIIQELNIQITCLKNQVINLDKARLTPLQPDQMNAELQQKVKAKEQELNSLQKAKNNLETQLSSLQAHLEKLTQANKGFAENENKLLGLISKNNAHIAELQSELSTANEKKAEQSKQISSLSSDLNTLHYELKLVKEEAAKTLADSSKLWKEEIADLESKIKDKDSALELLKQSLKDNISSTPPFKKEYEALKEELSEVQSQKKKIENTLNSTNNTLKNLNNELKLLRERNLESEQLQAQYKLDIGTKNLQLEKQKSSLESLQQQQNQQIFELQDKTRQINNLQEQVHNLQTQQGANADLKEGLHQEQLKQLNTQILQLRDEISTKTDSLKEKDLTIYDDLNSIELQEKEISQLKKDQLEIQQNNIELKNKYQELLEDYNRLKQSNDGLSKELEEKEEQIAELRQKNRLLQESGNEQKTKHEEQILKLENELRLLTSTLTTTQNNAEKEAQVAANKSQLQINSLQMQILEKENTLTKLTELNKTLASAKEETETLLWDEQLKINRFAENETNYKTRIQLLNEELSLARDTKNQQEEAVKEHLDAIRELKLQLENVTTQAQNEASQKESEWKNQITALKNQILQKEKAIEELSNSAKETDSKIDHLEKNNAEVKKELEHLKVRHEQIKKQLLDVGNRNTLLERTLEEKLKELTTLHNDKRELLTKVGTITDEKINSLNNQHDLKEKFEKLRNKLAEVDNTITQLENAKNFIEQEKNKLTDDFKQSQELVKKLERQITESREKHSNEISAWRNDLASLKNEKNELSKQLETLQQQASLNNQNQVSSSNEEIEKLKSQIQEHLEAVADAQAKLKNANEEIQNLASKNISYFNEKNEIKLELENAKQRNDQLEELNRSIRHQHEAILKKDVAIAKDLAEAKKELVCLKNEYRSANTNRLNTEKKLNRELFKANKTIESLSTASIRAQQISLEGDKKCLQDELERKNAELNHLKTLQNNGNFFPVGGNERIEELEGSLPAQQKMLEKLQNQFDLNAKLLVDAEKAKNEAEETKKLVEERLQSTQSLREEELKTLKKVRDQRDALQEQLNEALAKNNEVKAESNNLAASASLSNFNYANKLQNNLQEETSQNIQFGKILAASNAMSRRLDRKEEKMHVALVTEFEELKESYEKAFDLATRVESLEQVLTYIKANNLIPEDSNRNINLGKDQEGEDVEFGFDDYLAMLIETPKKSAEILEKLIKPEDLTKKFATTSKMTDSLLSTGKAKASILKSQHSLHNFMPKQAPVPPPPPPLISRNTVIQIPQNNNNNIIIEVSEPNLMDQIKDGQTLLKKGNISQGSLKSMPLETLLDKLFTKDKVLNKTKTHQIQLTPSDGVSFLSIEDVRWIVSVSELQFEQIEAILRVTTGLIREGKLPGGSAEIADLESRLVIRQRKAVLSSMYDDDDDDVDGSDWD